MESDRSAFPVVREPKLLLGPDLVKLVAEIDEFKGRWEALKTLSPDRLSALRRVATVESVGSSTRIEGAKLSDAEVEVEVEVEVETLLSDIAFRAFRTRDEQEVAGYAEAMDLVFAAHADLRLTENHSNGTPTTWRAFSQQTPKVRIISLREKSTIFLSSTLFRYKTHDNSSPEKLDPLY